MNLWDAHMHTSYSGDGYVPPEEMIRAARSKNLAGITLTDHLDWDYAYEPGLFDLDIPAYLRDVKNLSQRYTAAGFPVLAGLELGLQPHLAPRHQRLLAESGFDYVIGSVHVVHGIDPYYPAFFENRGVADAYREYYEATLENLETFSDIDALGHLDYVVRYGDKGADIPPYAPFADVLDAILHFLVAKDIALEVNTGSLRSGVKQPNPAPPILRRYRQLGGSLLTLGSDAHRTEHIAIGYERLPQLLRDCGFTEYAVYQNRQPALYPLP